MKVGFRVDASSEWGTGHVMRCLTLADELQELGAASFFICRKRPGDLISFIRKQGYPVYEIQEEVFDWKNEVDQVIQILEENTVIDWMVVDHYGLDARWERAVAPFVRKLMVIDDLADRPHACDVLLDQNLYRDMEQRYGGLLSKQTKLLLGPRYTLLRSEFIQKQKKDVWDGSVHRILVSFGGSDPTNETMKALKAIESLKAPLQVDAVIGNSNPHKDEVRTFCQGKKWVDLHIQTKDIATLMEKGDLAIGAGGSSIWERCYMHLPSVIIETAPNQTEIISSLIEEQAIYYVGKSRDVRTENLYHDLDKLMQDRQRLLNVWSAVKSIMKNHQPLLVSKYMLGGDVHD